ncbi:hypothetical protein [Cryptosporangium phraense]|uniref:Cupin domain-containing protein n=1 Tax=Cryptosporangium phraense TaxID=2593070 RepID=A0A545AVJ3_9ACTN|nr:hypothetical protein [Cryptosporangium phraense]TQS45301.1 hypothetical protein FL583_09385 [Cryptosporangium phraense]
MRITAAELEARTILRKDLVPDTAAFLDTKIPGSRSKVNYPLIGPGVSENGQQVVPVTEPHGFNLGGAVMPAGTVNNLHLHFTAEVFFCFAGSWTFRWGVDGTDGQATVGDGDVISIPTWIFRGFTSESDDAWLYTALGRDESGGLIWAPSVIAAAAETGMFLGLDHRLIEVEPGTVPSVGVVGPMSEDDLAGLRSVSVEEMRTRLARPDDLVWRSDAFLDDGGAELALVIGYGLTENRDQAPRLADPHGFSIAWLRAATGRGVARHRIDEPQVLIAKSGTWRVTLNDEEPVSVELGPYDTLSVPAGAWRRFESVGPETGQLALLTSGDGRVRIDWDPAVVAAARERDVALDANGYLAPAHLI